MKKKFDTANRVILFILYFKEICQLDLQKKPRIKSLVQSSKFSQKLINKAKTAIVLPKLITRGKAV